MLGLTNIVQSKDGGRVHLLARFYQEYCFWCLLFLASAILLPSYVYAGDGLSQTNPSQPTRVLPGDKPELEADDAQGALEFLCSIQQSNFLAMGPLELTMSEVVSIVGSESSTPIKQYELTIKHRETTIAGQLRSNVHREQTVVTKQGEQILSTTNSSSYYHQSPTFALTFNNADIIGYGYGMDTVTGRYSANGERRLRSFNPRSPVLYGFGDGDLRLEEILAATKSVEPEIELTLEPSQPEEDSYTFKLVNKSNDLTQIFLVSARRGGMVLESRTYDADSRLLREKTTESEEFDVDGIEVWFPIRWRETAYNYGSDNTKAVAVNSENVVEQITISPPGSGSAIEPGSLFPESTVFVYEEADGKRRGFQILNGRLEDELLNESELNQTETKEIEKGNGK